MELLADAIEVRHAAKMEIAQWDAELRGVNHGFHHVKALVDARWVE